MGPRQPHDLTAHDIEMRQRRGQRQRLVERMAGQPPRTGGAQVGMENIGTGPAGAVIARGSGASGGAVAQSSPS